MLASMTGFASHTVTVPLADNSSVVALVEIKSLNGRYFEANCKLPSLFNALEIDIVNLLKKRLIRGKVFFTLRLSVEAGLFERIQPAKQVIEQYLATAKHVEKEYGLTNDLTVANLLQMPDIFIHERQPLSDDVIKKCMAGVDTAIDQIVASRQREGNSLEADLKQRFALCGKHMQVVEADFEQLLETAKQEVKTLIDEVANGKDELKPKLEEAYAQLNRMDIHEEITRFKSHLSGVTALMNSQDPDHGRKLDFILQELMRETNTITAKCSTYGISALAVDIKVELEKAREQAQNIV